MKLELIVNYTKSNISLALLDNSKLIELHREKTNSEFVVGDIYLGKVRKTIPSLNSCFVDVGYEKDAFLHYLDLGPQFLTLSKFVKDTINKKQNSSKLQYIKNLSDIDKEGKIEDVISLKQQVLVQVVKEPISSKGPRLTSEITLAGRFIVLIPFSSRISISQKIKDNKEKNRLKEILDAIKPKNFGVIIRTVAQNRKVEEIESDLKDLMVKWNKLHQNLKLATPPKRVLGEMNKATSLIRDLFNKDFNAIHVNNEKLCVEFQNYIANISAGSEKIVKHYDGNLDIFENFGVSKQIKQSFGEKVPMSNGSYLIIEHTEAMHVIDVNSGSRKVEKNQEDNALAVNVDAAREIARILKLRDMGGIICIDFIDMNEKENNKTLFNKLKEFMKSDRAKHNILPPSKFGIIEVTRQRVRPETEIKTNETCPTCKGKGEVQASILYSKEIESKLDYIISNKNERGITLYLHPYLASYFKKGLFSKQFKWFWKYKKLIKIKEINGYNLLDYSFKNNKNKKIKI